MEAVNQEFFEESLDPANWNDLKVLGHRMIDDAVDYLKHVAERPVWKEIPDDVKNHFKKPLPQLPSDINSIYEDFKKNIFPYPAGNIHPKFFSWVLGTGTPLGALADLMAGVMNSNATIGDHSALYVDQQVINWCKEMLNYPLSASGILVSGASIANITALIVARNTVLPDIRKNGVYSMAAKLTAYCSTETHNCISKAMEVIGLGNEQLRKIPVDANYRTDINLLKEKIREDKAGGYLPFCIIGNAGTVNTGAIDPLDDLLAIAEQEKLWLHIDGAFGALAKLIPSFADELKAIEQADSIAFDLHKWMYMPYEVGCVLIKNAEHHRNAFATPASYLSAHDRGLAGGPETVSNYGMELSRGFKALKVWMSLQEHGIQKYGRLIHQNTEQASYLGSLVQQTEHLELLAKVNLNIVCYRYNPGHLEEQELNKLNKELLMRMHEQAVATPSYTILNGTYAIRVCITNHRTRKKDLLELIEGTIRIGDELMNELYLVKVDE